jgi:hypothetical protein
MDERQMFLETYNSNVFNDDDSSDATPDEMRTFFKRDYSAELAIGDKICVISGELQQAIGPIINF